MKFAAFASPETFSNLKNAFATGGQEAFHMQFRGSTQKTGAGAESIDMEFESRRMNHYRCFDFQIIPFAKKFADRRKEACAQFQYVFETRQALLFSAKIIWDLEIVI